MKLLIILILLYKKNKTLNIQASMIELLRMFNFIIYIKKKKPSRRATRAMLASSCCDAGWRRWSGMRWSWRTPTSTPLWRNCTKGRRGRRTIEWEGAGGRGRCGCCWEGAGWGWGGGGERRRGRPAACWRKRPISQSFLCLKWKVCF